MSGAPPGAGGAGDLPVWWDLADHADAGTLSHLDTVLHTLRLVN
jgi:hypothetical protein